MSGLIYTNASHVKVPCKGCERRTISCHETCEDYKAYRAEFESEEKRIKREIARQYKGKESDYYRDGWGMSRPRNRRYGR